jgi:dTDP-4-dehydrorhamnose 3,5-epimerase
MPFTFTSLTIPDVKLVSPKVFGDDRGFFLEFFKEHDFRENGISSAFLQDNFSRSSKNVVRGLHFQSGSSSQGKLVKVLTGKVWDVVVDVRLGSPTFGKWINVILDDEKHNMLWIPPGLAHGFCVLSDYADFIYKCTNYYDPISERGVSWNDPGLKIDWPILNPILSEKDKKHPYLADIPEHDLSRYA